MGGLKIQKSICLYFALIIAAASGFFFAVARPDKIGFYAFIAVAALGGFGVATYIYSIKKRGGQLVCPMGSDCNAVVSSRYSKFLGIKLEYLGMLYFAVIFVSYLALIFTPHLLSGLMVTAIVLLTIAAAGFSSYLLFVQAFLLRQWCIWCLLASFLSLSIFVTSLISVEGVVNVLATIQPALEAITALGFVLGMGGATVAVFMFYRFLRDLDIDDKEFDTLQGISELVWVGFALVLISQLALYVADAGVLAESGVFIGRITSVLTVGLSGAVLMIILAPFLSVVRFQARKTKEGTQQKPSVLESIRKPIFITGAVALSSWYFAFFTRFLTRDYTVSTMLLSYAATVIAGIIVALVWEKSIRSKSRN